MNAISSENEKNLTTAIQYYNAMLAKDFDTIKSYLHDDIHFISPLSEIHEKEEVLLAAKNLCQILENIEIRSKFTDNNQVMLVYDFLFKKPEIKLRSAVLMNFKNHKIKKIELFFDSKLLSPN